jgi:hypothetical protein
LILKLGLNGPLPGGGEQWVLSKALIVWKTIRAFLFLYGVSYFVPPLSFIKGRRKIIRFKNEVGRIRKEEAHIHFLSGI